MSNAIRDLSACSPMRKFKDTRPSCLVGGGVFFLIVGGGVLSTFCGGAGFICFTCNCGVAGGVVVGGVINVCGGLLAGVSCNNTSSSLIRFWMSDSTAANLTIDGL